MTKPLSKPSEPARKSDAASHDPVMREKSAALASLLAQAGLPFAVFETRRSVERQTWAFVHGISKARALAGPHVWGLAEDNVLVVTSDYWQGRSGPIQSSAGGAPWDTGVELVDGSCIVRRPDVVAAWLAYGRCAVAAGLEWGGDPVRWRSGRKGDVLGWDPAHVQVPNWPRFKHSTV